EQRPALTPGGHLLPVGCRLGGEERQGEIPVSEQVSRRALPEIETVGRPEHPGAQLRDRVVTGRLLPVAPLAGPGAVGPLDEVQRHAPHDELRRLGRETRVAPPPQPSLDVAVGVLRLRPLVL
ncbi:MAG: hypothetical protein ACK559_05605, partial [bacterium]